MRKALGLIFVLALMATPAMAQQVTIDYGHDFDFESVKTFQYVDTKESNAKNQLMADRVTSMLKQKLTEGGLKEVTENPDIYVTYHYTSQENTSYNTTSMGYGGYGGYYGGWGGWGGYGMGGMGTSHHLRDDLHRRHPDLRRLRARRQEAGVARHRYGDRQGQAREPDQAG